MTEIKTAVVILSFNGKYFLEKFLSSIIGHSHPYTIIVADNGSTDDTTLFMRTNYPQIRVIRHEQNLGYAAGYNLALQQIKAKYYVLLNSDVEVTPGWIDPIINLMDADPLIGACQPKILDYKSRNTFEYAGAAGGYIDKYGYPFCRGRIFNTLEQDTGQFNDVQEIFWATGACLFVRSDAYYKAGGLDGDYFAHMEEIDLCWRLKNFGYKIFVQPASQIYHIGGGTLNKLSRQKTFLNFRNNLTTLTKNHPPKYLFIKIIYRLLLDGVAGLKFLLEGQPKHCVAVIHAHFSYYGRISDTRRKRNFLRKQDGFRFSLSGIYKANIVMEYFLKKKTKFSDLCAGFFHGTSTGN